MVVQFSHSLMSDSLRPHGLQHTRLLCPSPTPGACSNFMSITSVMPSNHLILCHPLLLPPIFPSITVFSNESALHIRWSKYWRSPVAYWAPTDLGSSSFSILYFASSYCSWGSQGKNTEVVSHSLLQWTTFCQTSPPCPARLGWPHTVWLSFIEFDKAVVHVMRLASFL